MQKEDQKFVNIFEIKQKKKKIEATKGYQFFEI